MTEIIKMPGDELLPEEMSSFLSTEWRYLRFERDKAKFQAERTDSFMLGTIYGEYASATLEALDALRLEGYSPTTS